MPGAGLGRLPSNVVQRSRRDLGKAHDVIEKGNQSDRHGRILVRFWETLTQDGADQEATPARIWS